MGQLYGQIAEIISTVDFSRLWSGFHPLKFALYDEKRCFFDGRYVEKTAAFCANTAIEYAGEPIAIWNVSREIDPQILASKMIHEMFHAFQMQRGESRFPDELDALKRYRYDPVNLSVKLRENGMMAKLSWRFDRQTFETLLALRSYRLSRFPFEYRYEAAIEQIEGSANFVELSALEQINREKALEKREEMQRKICDAQNLFPIRRLCYDTGALMFMLLKEVGFADTEGFSQRLTMVDALDGVPGAPGVDWPDEAVAAHARTYERETEEIIREALCKGDCVAKGDFELLGVNVYDARRIGKHLVSTFFVSYRDEGRDVVLNGDFVVVFNDSERVEAIYRL